VGLLDAIEDKWGIGYSMQDAASIGPSEVEKVKADIRNIPPQTRGRIVT